MTFRSLETADLAGKRVLQAAVLGMAGFVASTGVTFGCLVRNYVLWPDMFARHPGLGAVGDPSQPRIIQLPGTGASDIALTLVSLLAMIVWLVAVVGFVRDRPRSPLTYVLAALVAGLFLWSSWGVWRLAYPVCNAM